MNTDDDETKVLFISRLPYNTTKAALTELTTKYAQIEKLLYMARKSCGFIELSTIEDANEFLEQAQETPLKVAGGEIQVARSKRDQIDIPDDAEKIGKVAILGSVAMYPEGDKLNVRDLKGVKEGLLPVLIMPDGTMIAQPDKLQIFGPQLRKAGYMQQQQRPMRSDPFGPMRNPGPGPQGPYPWNNPVRVQPAPQVMMMPTGPVMMMPTGQGQGGRILCVNNLPEEEGFAPLQLANFFSYYGDVLRVKVLHKQKSTVFIEFATSDQAQRTIRLLNGFELFDQNIKVEMARMPELRVQERNEGDADFTRDKRRHRFSQATSPQILDRMIKYITRPTSVLHVSNVPNGLDTEALKSLTGAAGVQLIDTGREYPQVLLRFASSDDAVRSMMTNHRKLVQGRHINLKFSKRQVEEE